MDAPTVATMAVELHQRFATDLQLGRATWARNNTLAHDHFLPAITNTPQEDDVALLNEPRHRDEQALGFLV
jgi:hypothetical protein